MIEGAREYIRGGGIRQENVVTFLIHFQEL